MSVKAKTPLNPLIAFLQHIYDPSPREEKWARTTYRTPTECYQSVDDSRLYRWLSTALMWAGLSGLTETALRWLNGALSGLEQPLLLKAPSSLIVNTDLELDEFTIHASEQTAQALRSCLGDTYSIQVDTRHTDQMITVSPELCAAFITDTGSDSLTIYQRQVDFDFEWATREFSNDDWELHDEAELWTDSRDSSAHPSAI